MWFDWSVELHDECFEMTQEIMQGVGAIYLDFQPYSEGCEEPFSSMLSCEIARLTVEKNPFWLLTVRKLWICRVGSKIGRINA